MEYISAILYHKIQTSDFTNMYEVKKYTGGNGQTYIQAAGYSHLELKKMFSHADKVEQTIEFWDKEQQYNRERYTVKAHVIGNSDHGMLEFAPRTKRKDYRISRQNKKNRHPAWKPENGFPEPEKILIDGKTVYKHEVNYPGKIDNLYILVIKTVNEGVYKYYASYVNSEKMPDNWPKNCDLEKIFDKSKKQGIIFYDKQFIRFVNIKECPFATGSAIDNELSKVTLPVDLNESVTDAIEFATKEIEFTFKPELIDYLQVEAPTIPKKTKSRKIHKSNVNHLLKYKNQKALGDLGELHVIELEKRRLEKEGRKDLADKVTHVSKKIGDGLGYDIISYKKFGNNYEEIYIEVKSTSGGIMKPFEISFNEVEVSKDLSNHYFIYRVFGINKHAKIIQYYILSGSVEDNFILTPISYNAIPKKH